MHSPERGVFGSGNSDGEQFDFFEVLDNVVPSEDLQRIQLDTHREVAYDPKERNSFLIFDYMSQTTAEIHFDTNGSIVSLSTVRMGGEGGEVETVWKMKHEEAALKFIADNSSLLGITNH